jgi:hypothetical protein
MGILTGPYGYNAMQSLLDVKKVRIVCKQGISGALILYFKIGQGTILNFRRNV